MDFILQELKVIENATGKESFKEKKQIELYLKQLQSRKNELSNIESSQPHQTESKITLYLLSTDLLDFTNNLLDFTNNGIIIFNKANHNKGIKALNSIKLKYNELLKFSTNNDLEIIDNKITFALKLAKIIILIASTVDYLGEIEVIAVIEKLDLENPIEEIKELEKKLTKMLKHNRFKNDYYPKDLIELAFKKLDRVSNNYGIKSLQPHQTEAENVIKDPFSSEKNLLIFEYLNKYCKPNNKSKFTYIFDFIKDEDIEKNLNEDDYFEYVMFITNITMTRRLVATATSEKRRENVKKVYLDFKKLQEIK